MVGAAAAAVGRIPRPISPRSGGGGAEGNGQGGDDVETGLMVRDGGNGVLPNGGSEGGMKMIHGAASTSSGNLSVGRYVYYTMMLLY